MQRANCLPPLCAGLHEKFLQRNFPIPCTPGKCKAALVLPRVLFSMPLHAACFPGRSMLRFGSDVLCFIGENPGSEKSEPGSFHRGTKKAEANASARWAQQAPYFYCDRDWSRTSTSGGHYPLKVARLPIPPRGQCALKNFFQKRVQR